MEKESLKAELLKKIKDEQEKYIKELAGMDPDEIMENRFEYDMRELMTERIRSGKMGEEEMERLLASEDAAYEFFGGHHEIDASKYDEPVDLMDIPVCLGGERHARASHNVPEYLASRKLNEKCRKALQDAVDGHSWLGWVDAEQVFDDAVPQYGIGRVEYVLAATAYSFQDRCSISYANMEWALATMPMPDSAMRKPGNGEDYDRNDRYVIKTDADVINKLIEHARKNKYRKPCDTSGMEDFECFGCGWDACMGCRKYWKNSGAAIAMRTGSHF